MRDDILKHLREIAYNYALDEKNMASQDIFLWQGEQSSISPISEISLWIKDGQWAIDAKDQEGNNEKAVLFEHDLHLRLSSSSPVSEGRIMGFLSVKCSEQYQMMARHEKETRRMIGLHVMENRLGHPSWLHRFLHGDIIPSPEFFAAVSVPLIWYAIIKYTFTMLDYIRL